MKPEELQIGDWVLYTEFGRNKKCKVEIIEPNRVWLNGCRTYVPIEFIEPIQLKPEILELNGFVEDEEPAFFDEDEPFKLWKLEDECISIIIKLDGSSIEIFNGNIVRNLSFYNEKTFYVHQLQQAMRLCGINKEIKL